MKQPAQTPADQQPEKAAGWEGGAEQHPLAFSDARPAAAIQRKLTSMAEQSPRMSGQRRLMAQIDAAPANNTGLPDALKSGIEALSGVPMDGVQVHYNSAKPAQLQALAYAQGSDIHLAPGQERHLPHEAWHVVQQRQGRVSATSDAGGVAINDDRSLEREADAMGERALQKKAEGPSPYVNWVRNYTHNYGLTADGIIQGVFDEDTVTNDIVNSATAIRDAGGSTKEAFKITTSGEHPEIFIKFTTSDFAVEAAVLARTFGIATPQAIAISKERIASRITALNPQIGATLNSKPFAIAFEFIGGENVNSSSKNRFNADSYRQIGTIAAFDMLIGKTDLFENFEQFNEEQENYNNVRVQGANLAAIDLSASMFNQARLAIVEGIIAAPGTVHRYVQRQVGNLFELDADRDRISLLQIQRSILSTIGSVTPEMANGIRNAHVKDSMQRFAAVAPRALGAVGTVSEAIEAEQRRRTERKEKEEAERAVAQDSATSDKVAKVAANDGCCYLTTACCIHYGLADDCEYLTVLRRFRDEWLLQQPNGEGVVQVYYKKAPSLLEAIGRRLDEDEIYALILKGIIIAVDLIKKNQMAKAAAFYQTMSISLEKAFAK